MNRKPYDFNNYVSDGKFNLWVQFDVHALSLNEWIRQAFEVQKY